MMKGKTINFNVLMKSSPGQEINVLVLLSSFNGFNNNPENQNKIVNFMTMKMQLNSK